MKTTVTLLILFTLFSLNTFAQDSPQWHLPEGAKVRLGKGGIGDIAYSPDGTRLAVAGSIGIWLYDTAAYQEIALLTGHTDSVYKRIVQSGRSAACQWEWGRYYPSMGRCNGSAPTDADRSYVNSVSFSPDGRTLASGSDDVYPSMGRCNVVR